MKTKYKLMTSATLAMVLLTGIVQAEGFFSNLFGGSKKGANLESLFQHVPADTAYLIANKQAIPEKVMDVQMKRGQDMLSMLTGSDGFKQATIDAKGSGKFFSALLEEYSAALSSGKLEDIGISTKANSVIYGYEMMPVMRIGVADPEKLMAMIKRAEEKSSFKVDFLKCGESKCFEATDPKGQMAISAVFLKDHFVVSAFSPDKKEAMQKHLMGDAKPSSAYLVTDWDRLLQENNYPGYGDGFLNLKSAFAFFRPLILQNVKGSMDDESLNGCLAVAENHIDNIPEIVFGTKKLEASAIDYELLFKTSEAVSTVLQTLANDSNIPQRTEGAIFDFGININFTKLRDALTKYSSFLINSGSDHKCPAIRAQEIRKSMGAMALVMNMGLSQFNSVYASVSDVQLDNKMQPKNIDAVVSFGSNDPSGLIAMVGMMAPAIMALKLPDDGSAVKLPSDLFPQRGSLQPDIFLSKTEKAINIFVGNDKPALKIHNNETAEISFSTMNIQSYLKTLANIMESMPDATKNSGSMPDLEVLQKIGEVGGKISSTTSADKRGLAVNYHIEY